MKVKTDIHKYAKAEIGFNKTLFTVLMLFFGLLIGTIEDTFAQIEAKSVRNPKQQGLTNWVNNQDNILSPQTVQLLNDNINRLYDSTSCQITVVVINGDKNTSARELSMELFDLWHPGMKDKNNGLLILVVTQSRQCFFRTGYGLEDVITDAKSTHIFSQMMKPYFIKGNWDEGVLNGTNEAIKQIYRHYDNPSNPHENKEDFARLGKTLLFGYIVLGIFVFIFCVYDLKSSVKGIAHTFRSKRVNTLKKKFKNDAIGVALFAFYLLPIYYMWYKRLLKKIRCEKIFCSCGHEMKLLSEKEEDEFLNHSQQLEERLKSRDYDVWLCPQCGRTVIYCYEENSSYSVCPVCHVKAYRQISEQTIYTGYIHRRKVLRRTYHCKNCNHTDHTDTDITDLSSAMGGMAAGSMLGGMSSDRSWGSSGGFGGFSGGSFGGGFSGGGGGGGSW